MNINDYCEAMNHVIPDPELKERIMNSKTTQKWHLPVRRVLIRTLAAVLTLSCLLTVALAASPELRTAVLSFFQLEEREQVPNGKQNGDSTEPDISQANIGQLVKAQYIRMDSRRYNFSGGLLNDLTWSDDGKTLLDAKFWEPKNGELVPVEVSMNTSKIDITFNDLHYQGKFYWFVREGNLCLFAGDDRWYDEVLDVEAGWSASSITGRTDVVMLNLSQGRQMEYTEYPFLYHLDTDEVEDILAGTGADALEYAYGYSWSEDMRRAVIFTGGRQNDQLTWFCDLAADTLVRLDELVDIDIYTAAFADDDTLILYSVTKDEEGILQDVTFYAYDIPSGDMKKTLGPVSYFRYWDDAPSGVQTFGNHCVLISEEGQVRIVDLKTGNQSLLEDFTYRKGDSFQLNTFGNQLLYYSMDAEPDGLGISQIGVADLDKGTFFAFDREGYENLHEVSIGWADSNTVCITADDVGSEPGARYMLLYQF